MGGRLQDKVAIVTGSGSVGPGWGNGKAMSVLFAREGAKVVGVDIDAEAAAATQKIISDEGGSAITVVADVTCGADVARVVAMALEAYGRIDILVNNVGIAVVGGPAELDEATWDRLMSVNIKSAYLKMCIRDRSDGKQLADAGAGGCCLHRRPGLADAPHRGGLVPARRERRRRVVLFQHQPHARAADAAAGEGLRSRAGTGCADGRLDGRAGRSACSRWDCRFQMTFPVRAGEQPAVPAGLIRQVRWR